MFILLFFIEILQANLKVCTFHDEQKYTYRNPILSTAIQFNLKLTPLLTQTVLIFTFSEL